jgi:hypothetical protein
LLNPLMLVLGLVLMLVLLVIYRLELYRL